MARAEMRPHGTRRDATPWHAPQVAGKGTVGFSDCTFVQWDRKNEGRHALQVSGGSVIVRGCEFQARRPQIELGEQVQRAVVTGNLFGGQPAMRNRSKGWVEIANNISFP